MTCRSGVVSVAIVVSTARTTASVLTPEPNTLRARTGWSGRVLYAPVAATSRSCAGCAPGVWDSGGASGEYLRGSGDVEGTAGHRTVSVSTRGATLGGRCPPAGPSREARDGPGGVSWRCIRIGTEHLDRLLTYPRVRNLSGCWLPIRVIASDGWEP